MRRELRDDLPVFEPRARRNPLLEVLHAALGVREGAARLGVAAQRKDRTGNLRCLREEHVGDDEALQTHQAGSNLFGQRFHRQRIFSEDHGDFYFFLTQQVGNICRFGRQISQGNTPAFFEFFDDILGVNRMITGIPCRMSSHIKQALSVAFLNKREDSRIHDFRCALEDSHISDRAWASIIPIVDEDFLMCGSDHLSGAAQFSSGNAGQILDHVRREFFELACQILEILDFFEARVVGAGRFDEQLHEAGDDDGFGSGSAFEEDFGEFGGSGVFR